MEGNETIRLLSKTMLGTAWGLSAQKGWEKPYLIEHNGEWYSFSSVNEADMYVNDKTNYDFTNDIEKGIYKSTGVKTE